MPKKSMRTALNEAMAQEMRRDPTVIGIGEDVVGGQGRLGDTSVGGALTSAARRTARSARISTGVAGMRPSRISSNSAT